MHKYECPTTLLQACVLLADSERRRKNTSSMDSDLQLLKLWMPFSILPASWYLIREILLRHSRSAAPAVLGKAANEQDRANFWAQDPVVLLLGADGYRPWGSTQHSSFVVGARYDVTTLCPCAYSTVLCQARRTERAQAAHFDRKRLSVCRHREARTGDMGARQRLIAARR